MPVVLYAIITDAQSVWLISVFAIFHLIQCIGEAAESSRWELTNSTEFDTDTTGYMLFVGGRACGVIEAKRGCWNLLGESS